MPKRLQKQKKRAVKNNAEICFKQASFCKLSQVFSEQFNIIIAMDNALPHMLSYRELECAVKSIAGQIAKDGMFVASIRDYDSILKEKPAYSTPYIHKTDKGQRVSFQTWEWAEKNYKFVQYIIDDEDETQISRFECEYRAVLRKELTDLLYANHCREVIWKMPEETNFYQPIVIAKK